MAASKSSATSTVLDRLQDAMNRHDIDAFVACFDPAYHSEQPAHPDRTFTGSEQVRKNWSALFAGIPDFRAELLRHTWDGDTLWAEWRWYGTRAEGSPVHLRGVTLFGAREEQLIWGRLYMEPVDTAGEGIDRAVAQTAGPDPGR